MLLLGEMEWWRIRVGRWWRRRAEEEEEEVVPVTQEESCSLALYLSLYPSIYQCQPVSKWASERVSGSWVPVRLNFNSLYNGRLKVKRLVTHSAYLSYMIQCIILIYLCKIVFSRKHLQRFRWKSPILRSTNRSVRVLSSNTFNWIVFFFIIKIIIHG